ncbi:carbohydrate-binding protein [Aquimarina sp. RZ0]|uniref:carbohydrate-binding protein n=1 Tax=Aquimarina sp. RZ0 TaxID=2607730 RepID=UPI0011F195D6|nr:carbohydrate-binding protein [Aquimarina sp. RZ0]KAA1242460.1 carbohydrate-binding protein [Aquimarina sp. RZ0]
MNLYEFFNHKSYNSVGNNGQGVRQNENVDTENKLSNGNIGWIAKGELLEYTINVTEANNYTITALVASSGNNGKFHIEFNGVDRTGIQSIGSTGNWDTFAPLVIANISLDAGKQVMRIYMDEGGFNLGSLNLEKQEQILSNTIPSIDQAGSDIKVYPNPSFDKFSIQGLENSNYDIRLMGVSGNLLIRKQLQQGNTTDAINVSQLARGLYLLHILNKDTNNVYTKKLQVVK